MQPGRWIIASAATLAALCGPLVSAHAPASLPDRLHAAEQRIESLLAEVRAMRGSEEAWRFQVKSIDVAKLAAALEPLVAQTGGRANYDERHSGLELAGSEATRRRIRRAVLMMDIERSRRPGDTIEMKLILLRHAKPADMAAAFSMGLRSRRQIPEVLPDVQAKAVIVRAYADGLQSIVPLINQLDVAIGIEASSAEFRLVHVRALSIAESLRTLYGESNARIAAHVPMNTVFVRASNADQLEEIAQFIRLIDVEKLK